MNQDDMYDNFLEEDEDLIESEFSTIEEEKEPVKKASTKKSNQNSATRRKIEELQEERRLRQEFEYY